VLQITKTIILLVFSFRLLKNTDLDALEANMEFKLNSVPSYPQQDKERSPWIPKPAAGTSLVRMSLIRFDCDSCVYPYEENDGLMSFPIQLQCLNL
jgi:hypothetical protein